MRTILAAGIALAGMLMATPALAGDQQYWGTVTEQAGLGGAWRVNNETVLRSSDSRGFYEIEENFMVGYKANKHMTLWLGYTFDPNYLHGQHRFNEQRFRQQVNYDNLLVIGPVRLSGRVRLEERWREGNPGTAWRLRPLAKLAITLHGKTTLNATHESFVDLNTTTFQRVGGEERMRNTVYIATPLTKQLSIDAGYLEQHGFVRGGPDTHDHVVALGLSLNL